MTRDVYLSALSQRLQALPREDRDNAMRFYAECFDDAGADNEQSLIARLGDPATVAARLLEDAADKRAAPRRHAWWVFVLGVLALPIALPLAIGAACVLFALGITAFALVLSMCVLALVPGICLVAFAGAGLASLVFSAMLVVQHLPTSFVFAGMGLTLLALSGLLWVPYQPMMRQIIRSFPRACQIIAAAVASPFQRRRSRT